MSAPVSRPYISLSDPSPVEGTWVWMSCGITDGTDPVHYMWEQENRSGSVIILLESENNQINISSVSRNHTGWYRCLAKNEVSQQRSDRMWLDVICKSSPIAQHSFKINWTKLDLRSNLHELDLFICKMVLTCLRSK